VRHDLTIVIHLCEATGHGFRAGTILLGPDAHTVQLALIGRQLAEERRIALFTQVRRQLLSIVLIGKTAQLYGPHSRC